VIRVKGDPGCVIPHELLMSGFYPNDGGDPSRISEDSEQGPDTREKIEA
jgi:hypothetical protein